MLRFELNLGALDVISYVPSVLCVLPPAYVPPAGAYYAQTPATRGVAQSAPAATAITTPPAARAQPIASAAASRPNPTRFQAASAPAPAPAAPAGSNQPWPPALSRSVRAA